MRKLTRKQFEEVSLGIRKIFQELLHDAVPKKKAQDELAKAINKSPSLISKMVYNGEGGLDSWAEALAITRNLDFEVLRQLKYQIKKAKPLKEFEKIFIALRDDLKATDEEMEFILLCGWEAINIKRNLEKTKRKKSRRSRS